jgi:TATA-box binding protein (TBP) (component of TFIID and TFIIIB)
MYSSIANNTFSYFLTLNAFREKIKRDHPEIEPSWIKLTTITMISQFKRDIDIPFLKAYFDKQNMIKLTNTKKKTRTFNWTRKETTFFNQISLIYEDHHSTKSVKVFPNGSIQVAGCADLFDCKRVIRQLSYMFSKILGKEYIIPEDSFRVVMINSNFSLNKNLNLIETARKFEDVFKMSFEPDRYSAVKVKFRPAEDMKEITTSIFSTGKIIITGAETLKEIAFAYNIIISHILEHKKSLITTDIDPLKKEVFDVASGYNINDIIKEARNLGQKSWVDTIKNKQINF